MTCTWPAWLPSRTKWWLWWCKLQEEGRRGSSWIPWDVPMSNWAVLKKDDYNVSDGCFVCGRRDVLDFTEDWLGNDNSNPQNSILYDRIYMLNIRRSTNSYAIHQRKQLVHNKAINHSRFVKKRVASTAGSQTLDPCLSIRSAGKQTTSPFSFDCGYL